MKYLFIIATMLATPLISINAQSLRDLWIQMPDSIVAYLDMNMRTEMADFYQMITK